MPRLRRSGAQGFSLVELLVVVSIIAVLAGIVLPALRAARMRALEVNCKSNLRQISNAFFMYESDWNCMPTHQWKIPTGSGTFRNRWFWQLESYLATLDVEKCPAAVGWVVGRNSSYGYNYRYLGSSRGNTDTINPYSPLECFPRKLSDIKVSSRTIAFADSDGTGLNEPYEAIPADQAKSALSQSVRVDLIGNHGYTLDPTYVPAWCPNSSEEYADGDYRTYISTRHGGGSNVLFVDGHIEKLFPERGIYEDNALWNGLGVEDTSRDNHVSYKSKQTFRY